MVHNSLLALCLALVPLSALVPVSETIAIPAQSESVPQSLPSDDLYAFLSDPKVQEVFQEQPLASMTDDKQIIAAYSAQRQKRLEFYSDYLTKYYPKARVITYNYLALMDAAQIEKTLGEIVAMFTQETWHYVANNPHQVNLIYYWEFLTDQLSLIHDFLVRARYNIPSNSVFVPSSQQLYLPVSFKYEENPFLVDYLLDAGYVHTAQFFALSFDFVVKLFNENIMLSDYKAARYYLSELEYLEGNMRGTIYEIDYQEHVKTAREILAKFKEKNEAALHRDEEFRIGMSRGRYDH